MAVASALAALHTRLADDSAREAYWAALTQFLRFEISKPDFDKRALAALGPNVALHNSVILALLQDAQRTDPMETDAASGPTVFGLPAVHTNGSGGSSSHPQAASHGVDGAAPAPLPGAGPKLMLKIGSHGVTAQRPEIAVRYEPHRFATNIIDS